MTIFEKEQTAGGMIRCGMPDYALNKTILEEEIAALEAHGVKFQFGKALGRDVLLENLADEGYERVFLAIGANARQDSPIPGAENCLDARELLCSLNRGEDIEIKKNVVVLGNGFAAMDAARAAVRLGAEKVTLLNPTAFGKRSGDQEARKLALEEGVALLDQAAATEITDCGVSFSKNGVPMQIPCDQVILANEYRPDAKALEGVSLERGFVEAVSGRTNVPGVYAGGDAVRSANVISAIAAGKNAAAAIDRDIRGKHATLQEIPATKTVNPDLVRRRTGYLKKDSHALKLNADAVVRKHGFVPYERVMTEAEALKEASRCLNCGCGEGCQLCKTICTDFAPKVADTDTMHICKEECVACGMCFNRCPNGNIEMVNLGETI